MIKQNFLYCRKCKKKIMPIFKRDFICATVYCSVCKSYYRVKIQAGCLLNSSEESADKIREEVGAK